jgi:crotonobetainyl-CoA:carnitine CoA-transferase CaiB-like acyl-CoA transferase
MARPLEDVTIADFSQMQQGAWATMKLGDMGADVIKIEPPHGDLIRQFAMGGELFEGVSAAYLAMNRNKRSVTLDMKTDEGVEAAKAIVREADVLFENFRPGVIDKFGLSYEDVREFNPGIVYVSGSGWGSTGPYAERPGQDLLAQATSGLTKATGRRDDLPTAAGTFVCDAHSATVLAFHTLAALHQRDRTGEGQKIEGDLLSAGVDLQSQELTATMSTDVEFERSAAGTAHVASGAPYGIYETADDYLAMSFANLPALADDYDLEPICDYEDPGELYEHRDAVMRQVQDAIGDEETDELVEHLTDIGMWVAEVNGYEEVVEDPQVRHNDLIVEIDHPELGSFETTGVPVRMSGADYEFSPPPEQGENTEEVLRELGYDEDRIAAVTGAGDD